MTKQRCHLIATPGVGAGGFGGSTARRAPGGSGVRRSTRQSPTHPRRFGPPCGGHHCPRTPAHPQQRIIQSLRPRATRLPAMPKDVPPKKNPGATSRILPAPDPPVPPLPHPLLLQGCWWGSVTKCPPLGAHNNIGALGHPHPRRGGSVGRDRAAPGVWWGRNAGTARESHAGEPGPHPGPDPGPLHPPGKLTSWRMSSSLGMMESSSTSSLRGEGTEGD